MEVFNVTNRGEGWLPVKQDVSEAPSEAPRYWRQGKKTFVWKEAGLLLSISTVSAFIAGVQ